MSSVSQYFKDLFQGIGGLLTGMSVTLKELFTKKVTQQYPENRKTLVISDRFRGELVMPHDENNEHNCTSCGICEMNCPNGTIKITSKMIQTEDGKKKKILDTYYYNLGMCTFCNLCVITCPSDAIKFDNVFENAIFTKDKLNMRLNHEGSKLKEKKKPQPKAPVDKPAVEKPVAEKPEKTGSVTVAAKPQDIETKAEVNKPADNTVEEKKEESKKPQPLDIIAPNPSRRIEPISKADDENKSPDEKGSDEKQAKDENKRRYI